MVSHPLEFDMTSMLMLTADRHTDVSFEMQPPGTTFLYLLDGPPAGGDTLYVPSSRTP